MSDLLNNQPTFLAFMVFAGAFFLTIDNAPGWLVKRLRMRWERKKPKAQQQPNCTREGAYCCAYHRH